MLDLTNKKHLNAIICALLSVLNGAEGGEAPEGIMYAAIIDRVGLDDWKAIRNILIAAKLCEPVGNHVLRITDKGRELARKADEFAAKIAAAKESK